MAGADREDPRKGACPRCADDLLVPAAGVLQEDICARCHGRFLAGDVVERVVVEELGVSHSTLRELFTLFAGLRLRCPSCAMAMRPIRLRGVAIDLCPGCGGAWFDAGELLRLAHGRYAEVSAGRIEVSAPTSSAPALEEPRPAHLEVEPLPRARLGRGPAHVFLVDPDPPALSALAAAFAATDGLTAFDAQSYVTRPTGVVVEGCSVEGAEALVSLLERLGLRARAVDAEWLTLPVPHRPTHVEATPSGLRVRAMGEFELPWVDCAAMTLGVVDKIETVTRATRPKSRVLAHHFAGFTAASERSGVDTADVVLELMFAGRAPTRVRISSRALRMETQRSASVKFIELVDEIAAHARYAGRSVALRLFLDQAGKAPDSRLPAATVPLRLERELSWLWWRFQGPGQAFDDVVVEA